MPVLSMSGALEDWLAEHLSWLEAAQGRRLRLCSPERVHPLTLPPGWGLSPPQTFPFARPLGPKMSVLWPLVIVSFVYFSCHFRKCLWAPCRQNWGFSFSFHLRLFLSTECLLCAGRCAMCQGHSGDGERHRPVSWQKLDAGLVLRTGENLPQPWCKVTLALVAFCRSAWEQKVKVEQRDRSAMRLPRPLLILQGHVPGIGGLGFYVKGVVYNSSYFKIHKLFIHIYMYISMCVCVCLCVHIYVYVCICTISVILTLKGTCHPGVIWNAQVLGLEKSCWPSTKTISPISDWFQEQELLNLLPKNLSTVPSSGSVPSQWQWSCDMLPHQGHREKNKNYQFIMDCLFPPNDHLTVSR